MKAGSKETKGAKERFKEQCREIIRSWIEDRVEGSDRGDQFRVIGAGEWTSLEGALGQVLARCWYPSFPPAWDQWVPVLRRRLVLPLSLKYRCRAALFAPDSASWEPSDQGSQVS